MHYLSTSKIPILTKKQTGKIAVILSKTTVDAKMYITMFMMSCLFVCVEA